MRKEFVNMHIGRLSDDEAQKYEKTGLYIYGCVIDDKSDELTTSNKNNIYTL